MAELLIIAAQIAAEVVKALLSDPEAWDRPLREIVPAPLKTSAARAVAELRAREHYARADTEPPPELADEALVAHHRRPGAPAEESES